MKMSKIDKDSLIAGFILAIIWVVPIEVTVGITTAILSEALWVVIVSAIITVVVVLLLSILGTEALTPKIMTLVSKRSFKLFKIIAKHERIVFIPMIVIGDAVSVLIPVLLAVFVF